MIWFIFLLVIGTILGIWLFIKGLINLDSDDAEGYALFSGIVLGICLLGWIGILS